MITDTESQNSASGNLSTMSKAAKRKLAKLQGTP